MKERANPLGTFLRARRERVLPAEVGIVTRGVRRVPGLRRDELAMLAGISTDYYLRLERGRDRRPSQQVVTALSRALHLNADHAGHLERLAALRPVLDAQTTSPEPPAALLTLLRALPFPAFLEDAHLGILASNAPASTLNPRLQHGRNQLRDFLLDEEEQRMHPDLVGTATCLITSLRYAVAEHQPDSRVTSLIDELHAASPLFRTIWAGHAVRAQRGASLTLIHPRTGAIQLHREQLTVNGAPRLKLVVYYPET